MAPGFRRRILIEPAPGRVTAELEDDYHRMVVTIDHAGGVATDVRGDMKRWPWTACPGAIEALGATFAGVPIAQFARRGDKPRNCTHLHDLAVFGAAHADARAPIAYDVAVADPVDGVRTATLARDGAPVLAWTLADDLFVSPPVLAGRRIADLGEVVREAAADAAEAIRILRWACILALGRAMTIPAGIAATAFPGAACYNFQPERAAASLRRPDAARDLSRPGVEPMADRAEMFAPR